VARGVEIENAAHQVATSRSRPDYGARSTKTRQESGALAFLIRILINAAALWVAVALLDGLSFDDDWWKLLVIALILGVANAIVRPILSILSLPFVILTLGLFLLVVNAVVLALVIWLSGAIGIDFDSRGFGWTFLGALIVSLVSWGLETLLRQR
jgi:putative membrane protein